MNGDKSRPDAGWPQDSIRIEFDGRSISCSPADTVGSCLLRAGVVALRSSATGQSRGLYCGIGICNDCLVRIDGDRNVRACVTPVEQAMKVFSQASLGSAPRRPT